MKIALFQTVIRSIYSSGDEGHTAAGVQRTVPATAHWALAELTATRRVDYGGYSFTGLSARMRKCFSSSSR